MPFCTKCGATVIGAFCSTCGTPASASASPTERPDGPGALPPPEAVPVQRKTSPIVWVLVVVLGFFLLLGLGAAGVAWFVVRRAHQAGVSFDRSRDGGVTITTRDGQVEFGNAAGRLPSWVPEYPGSRPTFSVRARGEHGGSSGEGGNFTFTTADPVSQVLSFYEEKCRDLGMKVDLTTSTGESGMVVAVDEQGERRSLTVVVGGGSGQTSVNVTYARK